MYDITLNTTTECGEKLNVVYLRHAPHDAEKLARIAESMQTNGWRDRPVILQDCGDYTRAYTGTHRLTACINSDTEVQAVWLPVDLSSSVMRHNLLSEVQAVWLPADLSAEHAELLDDANDDLDLLAALREIQGERGDITAVVAAMEAEIEAAE